MLKKIIIVSTFLTVSTSFCLSAESSPTLEFSLKHYNYNYSEVVGDSEKAWMNGIHLSYKNQNKTTKNYWKVSYDRTNHDTNYDGYITYYTTAMSSPMGGGGPMGGPMSGPSPTTTTTSTTTTTTPYQGITNNKIINTEFTYGFSLSNAGNTYVYTGIGSHSWNRNLQGSGGYLEQYSWNYIPIGYRVEYKINNKWNGALDISAKFMFNGSMNTAYNGGSTSGIGNNYNLGSKVGYKVELPLTSRINSNWSLVITPWYESSAIGQSNTVSNYYEPNSTTHQYGIDLGVSYTF